MTKIVGTSYFKLISCHPDLQAVVHKASDIMDLSVICGHRNEHDQNAAYQAGKSTKQWPDSKHNAWPSHAVDILPYFDQGNPYDWDEHLAFARLAGTLFAVAFSMGVKIRWGGDWNQNNRSNDERLLDLGHFELC